MNVKTKGVVLHTTKYSDTSSIVTMYTEVNGRMSFLVRGLTSRRSSTKAAFFIPLSFVDMDISFNPNKDLQIIKDIRVDFPLTGIAVSPMKNAMALFLSEVLYRTLRTESSDEGLFAFLSQSTQVLDVSDSISANFHLIFMLKLTRYLGCEPHFNYQEGYYFDMLNGEFVQTPPIHVHYILGNLANAFSQLSTFDYFSASQFTISRDLRVELLNVLVEYYRLHIPNFHTIHSLSVLKSIFD